MNKDQIKHMVDRFLMWRLPKPWNPDNGISYKRPNYMHAPADHDWPVGTNLFDAEQATTIVRHMIEGLPESSHFGWLIEAPGPRYLATRALPATYHEFVWTASASDAIRFRSKHEADGVMMTVRRMDPSLFAFEKQLGDAKPIERGWLDAA